MNSPRMVVLCCAAVQRGELERDGEDKRAPRDTEQPRFRLRCWLHSPVPDPDS